MIYHISRCNIYLPTTQCGWYQVQMIFFIDFSKFSVYDTYGRSKEEMI